jgi:hypothetical protein
VQINARRLRVRYLTAGLIILIFENNLDALDQEKVVEYEI